MTDTDTRRIHGSLGRIEAKLEHHDQRFDELQRRLEAEEADADGLRQAAVELRSSIERLPCERHAERLREATRKISEVVKTVRADEVTGQVQLAKLEAERAAREKIAASAARRWQIAAAIAAIVGTAAGLGLFKLLG